MKLAVWIYLFTLVLNPSAGLLIVLGLWGGGKIYRRWK